MPLSENRFARAQMSGFIVAVAVVASGPSAAASAVSASSAAASHLARPIALAPAGPTPMPTIGRPAPEKHPDAPITLNSLHRDKLGLVSLTWTLANNDQSESMNDPPSEVVNAYDYVGPTAGAVTLTDESAKVRYSPLRMDPGKTCVCTNGSAVPSTLANGQSAIYYEVYKLPLNVKSVTVTIPGYSPTKDIYIN